MSEKKQESFTVTDRRLFTSEGESRQEASEEISTSAVAPAVREPEPVPPGPSEPVSQAAQQEIPPPPTADEQKQQADAYRESAKDMDTRVELSGHSAQELEMTFERFMASLYMTAMMQLGLMHEQGGEPRMDIIGARQTIDTLTLAGGKNQRQSHVRRRCLHPELSVRAAHGLCGSHKRAFASAPGDRSRKWNRQAMKARLTVLGSGTSMGVPTIGCDCAVCHSSDPHDRRTRPSVLIEYEGHAVLIDTTPDFREQAIRENIRHLDAVLYTHTHADHILGIDDLRPLSFPTHSQQATAVCATGGSRVHPQYVSLHF